MQTLDQSLLALCRDGAISREEALARSVDAQEMVRLLPGVKGNSSF